MGNPKILASSSSPVRDERDLEAVKNALFSGGLAGTDGIVKAYESALAECFGVKHAVAVSSGTAAIHASLAALGVKRGDEVIVPSMAAVMTALPVLALGARPVFADCAKESFALDVARLPGLISERTKAAISVPMWGYPTTTRELKAACAAYNIPIAVDTAQGIGTRSCGMLEGTNGDVGCFSTHEIKLLSTGEGGFVLSDDAALADEVRGFIRVGNRAQGGKKEFGVNFGVNYKLNGLAAGLGLAQIEKLSERLKRRQENARIWADALAPYSEFLTPFMPETESDKPSFYAAIYLLNADASQAISAPRLAAALDEAGVETDMHKYGLKLMPDYEVFRESYALQSREPARAQLPHAADLMDRMVILPTHEGVTEGAIAAASRMLVSVIKENCVRGAAVRKPSPEGHSL